MSVITKVCTFNITGASRHVITTGGASPSVWNRLPSRRSQGTANTSAEVSDGADEEAKPPKDISGLLPQHRNMLYNQQPYSDSQSWVHNTVRYQQMQFGRIGLSSGVDPRVCFPTEKDEQYQQEYERVSHPLSLEEMIANVKRDKHEAAEKIKLREDDIRKKLVKLEQWTKDLNARIAKKENEARAAVERKERIIEEVRRQLGFKVDMRDERFKEMLDQKEKEERKKMKQAKKLSKETKMVEKLVNLEVK